MNKKQKVMTPNRMLLNVYSILLKKRNLFKVATIIMNGDQGFFAG
jgi:hypothetical protein